MIPVDARAMCAVISSRRRELSPRKAFETSFLSKDAGALEEFVSRPLHLGQEINVSCSFCKREIESLRASHFLPG